ncbi:uncharacterized protein LOC115737360, partial [Rhodamnia argentea]|uniref:Uncharacterized protein LOC115737360 n=1 Tax=Rhodamnia argentea TaxID=178133 RepID=A0A8B8NS08_9MYRT
RLCSAFIQALGIAEETGKAEGKGKADDGYAQTERPAHDQAQWSGKASSKDGEEDPSSSSASATATGFQMPLHYPRYTKADYEKMEEWRLDLLLREYGINYRGSLEEKRAFAIGAFLWHDRR